MPSRTSAPLLACRKRPFRVPLSFSANNYTEAEPLPELEQHRTKWHKGKHSLFLAKGQGLTLQALYKSPSVLCLLSPELQANLCNIQDI